MEKVAGWAYGGEWVVAEDGPGRIVLVAKSQQRPTGWVADNVLQCCRMRQQCQLSAAAMRDAALGRLVPWSCVQLKWAQLKGPAEERPVCSRPYGAFACAVTKLHVRLRHMLQCLGQTFR